MLSSRCFVALAVAAVATFSVTAQETKLKYPETKKGDVVDDYHGTKVADPYRWLEDDVRKSKDVADWVEAENKVTFAFLEAIPEREAIKKRLTELWNYEKFTAPFKDGGRYFFSQERRPAEPVRALRAGRARRRAARAARPEHAGRRTAPSPSPAWRSATTASYLAYGVAEAGSDWNELEGPRRRHRQGRSPTS